jgi:hypothetical protein
MFIRDTKINKNMKSLNGMQIYLSLTGLYSLADLAEFADLFESNGA